ncbi:MAG: hypothetical protein FJ290_00445 [Planctomycetes bacterium]|nr:hypothetical protein [Planctomycetota bacterium]
MAEAMGEHDEARLHLEVDGSELLVSVPVPLGPRTLLDLLPAARAIAQALAAHAAEAAAARGRTITCRRGCAACCRQYLSISVVEAEALARAVAGLPAQRRDAVQQRFDAALLRLEQAGLLDPGAPRGGRRITLPPRETPAATVAATSRRYFGLAIPCPRPPSDKQRGLRPQPNSKPQTPNPKQTPMPKLKRLNWGAGARPSGRVAQIPFRGIDPFGVPPLGGLGQEKTA